MSKEFKNIDELFRSTIGMGSAKAPSHIKTKVLSKTGIGGSSLWLVGAGLLLVTVVSALVTVVNMPENSIVQSYQSITQKESLEIQEYNANTLNTHVNQIAKSEDNRKIISTKKNNHKVFPKTQVALNSEPKREIKNKQTSEVLSHKRDRKKAEVTLLKPQEIVTQEIPETSPKQEVETTKSSESNTKNTVDHIVQNDKQVDDPKAEIKLDNSTEIVSEVQSIDKPSNPVKVTNSPAQADTTQTYIEPTENTVEIVQNETLRNLNTTKVKPEEPKVSDNDQTDFQEEKPKKADSLKPDINIELDLGKPAGYWITGFKGGPNINNANYTSSEFSQPLGKLHNERLGYFGQVYGQYVSAKGFTAGIGLGIERQSYNTTFLTEDTIIGEDGATIINFKDHFGITNSQYLQIPLQVGCQIERNKLIFGADLGVQINYLLKADGTYLLNNEVLPIDNQSIFKSTTLVYSVSGNLKYNVFKKLYLTTDIRYVPSFQNYYENTYAKRAVSSFSFGFGLAYKW